MLFEKIKVDIHETDGHCLVHLIYGNEASQEIHAGLLNALLKANIAAVPTLTDIPTQSQIDEALKTRGSLCYRLDGANYRTKTGYQDDGQTISFYTATKDQAKAALSELKQAGFKFNQPLPALYITIDRAFEKRAR